VLEGKAASAQDVIPKVAAALPYFYPAKSGSGAPLGPGRVTNTLPDSG